MTAQRTYKNMRGNFARYRKKRKRSSAAESKYKVGEEVECQFPGHRDWIGAKIIDNKDSKEWNEAINLVNNTTNWDYNKLIKMIEGQYGTYGNKSALQSTWSYRAKALDEMYEDCVNGIEPKSNQTKDITQKVIQGKDFNDLRKELSDKTKNISIDENSIKFDVDNLTVKFNTGKTKIIKISLLFDDVSKQNLDDRLKNAKVQNPTYKVITRGEEPYWWALSIIE